MAIVVTEQMLRDMLHRAYMKLPMNPDKYSVGDIDDWLYERGQFKKLIGAVVPTKTRKK